MIEILWYFGSGGLNHRLPETEGDWLAALRRRTSRCLLSSGKSNLEHTVQMYPSE